jgi:WD40 repeat protein
MATDMFGGKKPKLVTVVDHESTIKNIAFTPDRNRILTLSDWGFKLWDENGKPLNHIDASSSREFLVSPDGKRILLLGKSTTTLLDEDGNIFVKGLPLFPQRPEFSPDGSLILTHQGLWDRDGFFLTDSFSVPVSQVKFSLYTRAALFSPDGRQILTLMGRTLGKQTSDHYFFEAKLWEMLSPSLLQPIGIPWEGTR